MNQIIKNIITSNFFSKILSLNDKSIASILTLHRINYKDNDRLIFNEQLKITPEYLESLIILLTKEKYAFVSIDELYELMSKNKIKKKLIVFTLDDGYKDNYEYGLPIFDNYSIPFTIYVSTSFPERSALFWWYLLEDIILENDFIELNDGSIFNCFHKEEKEKVFLNIRQKILTLNQDNFSFNLNDLLLKYALNLSKYNNILGLTWSDINKLSLNPLVTIGNHTHNHLSMTSYSNDAFYEDLLYSNKLFNINVKKVPEHFSYPYGNYLRNNENDKILRSLNYKTAVTTKNGNIYKTHINSMYYLPRISVIDADMNINKTISLMKFKRK